MGIEEIENELYIWKLFLYFNEGEVYQQPVCFESFANAGWMD